MDENFKESDIKYFFGQGGDWKGVVKYFVCKKEYFDKHYIDNLKFFLESEVNDAEFEIILYDVDYNKYPKNIIESERIIGTCEKGKKYTTIDILRFKIKIPFEGICIGLRWLKMEKNEHKYNSHYRTNTKKRIIQTSIQPNFGTVPSTIMDTYILKEKKWEKTKKGKSILKKYDNKYPSLAIHLEMHEETPSVKNF